MDNENNRIKELENEIAGLKAELEKAKEKERNIDESRRAMLFMLEDLERSQEFLSRAKNEYEATFDGISDPLFIHDRDFKIVRANRAYQEMSGMKFKELLGKPYYEVFPKMNEPFKMCLKARELQEEEEEEEEEFSHPVTNKIFKVRFYPIKDVNGSYLYSIHILEDITEKKRAEESLKDEMEINKHLLSIAAAIAHTTDIDKLMDRVIHCIGEIMRCDICLSYIYDKNMKVFKPIKESGLPRELIPIFRTETLNENVGFVKEIMKGKRVAIEQGAAARPISWIPEINIMAVIPFVGRKDLLGCMLIIYRKEKEFAERDMKIMDGISYQVSTALEEARLYKDSIDRAMELSHKIETIQVMHEIDRNILSTLKSEDILEIAIRMVAKVIPCDRATVMLVDKEKKGVILAAGFGITSIPKGAFIPSEDTIGAEVIETGRPQYIPNLMDIGKLPPAEEKLLKEGFLSHIRVPVFVKDEVVAAMGVGAKRTSAFTPEDLSTLEKLAYQIGVALENSRLITDLEELFLGTVKSLSSAIDAKSPWTAGHSERVTKYAIDIGKGMGLSQKELKDLELGGLLHDIGKLGTYETILDKPGKLTDEEFNLIKQHPVKGEEILSPIKQIRHVIPIVRHHHERYDGKGYPDGIKGEEIHLMARIMCVADSVDAMGADRPYRKGRPMDDIIAEVKRCSGTQFDPAVSEIFLKVV